MYSPSAFTVTDADIIDAMMRRSLLACLITSGPGGLFASHLPLLYDRDGGVLAGHLARANPHRGLEAGGEALVIFQGPSAYVSPNWYPSKAEGGRVVPTWNYEALHIYGQIVWREDKAWLRDNVSSLSERFEADQPHPWALSDAPADYIDRMLGGIVGLEIRIGRIEAKRKLSQNRSDADRRGVMAGLAASPRVTDHTLAALMAEDQG
jgi:transcriptional regulator